MEWSSTTNLSEVLDLGNVTNLSIEMDRGKIDFSESVNLSDGVDLDLINISLNRIEIDPGVLSALDKSATLYLNNLTYSNPRVLKDGSVCDSAICVENSYEGGVFSFNVTGFSVYSAGETPSTPTTDSGGGGGGGSTITTVGKLTISPNNLEISMIKDTVKTRKIELYNPSNKNVDVKIKVEGLEEIIAIEKDDLSFKLDSKETKEISFRVFAPENPGIYTGKIIVNNQDVLVSINIDTEDLLFDIGLEVPDDFRVIDMGENLYVVITMIPMGDLREDVILNYVVKDFSGNVYLTESETMLMDKEKVFKKDFETENFIPGDYNVGVELIYSGGVATASSNFVIKGELFSYHIPIIIVIIIIIIETLALALIGFWLRRKYRRLKIEELRYEKENREQKYLKHGLNSAG